MAEEKKNVEELEQQERVRNVKKGLSCCNEKMNCKGCPFTVHREGCLLALNNATVQLLDELSSERDELKTHNHLLLERLKKTQEQLMELKNK
jgi:hypothetical protein